MKARIDGVLCTGHGRCWVMAARVYRLDDNGYNADRGSTIAIDVGEEGTARVGADACPEQAIVLEE
jgi:ferredoxin